MNLFVVRGEDEEVPASYLLGVYATLEEAEARVIEVQRDELEIVWIDDVKLGEAVFLSNY